METTTTENSIENSKKIVRPSDCYHVIHDARNSITTFMLHCESMAFFCSNGIINNADAIPKLQSEIDRCSQGLEHLEQIYSNFGSNEEIKSLVKDVHYMSDTIERHRSQLKQVCNKVTPCHIHKSVLETALNDDYSYLASIDQRLTSLCSPIYQEVLLLWSEFPLKHETPNDGKFDLIY